MRKNKNTVDEQKFLVKSFWANIYVGTRIAYSDDIVPLDEIKALCKAYCSCNSAGLTFTPTTFIYKDGEEPGVIGLINYPRFPCEPEDLKRKAYFLANELRIAAKQIRVTVVTPDDTMMFGPKE